ncbi:hypothetical protein D9M71_668450 [compost metagenome]
MLADAQRPLAGDAVLHQQAVDGRGLPGFEHGVCAADAGMAGERHFLLRREHADAVAAAGSDGRADEGGFGQAGPAGDGLHGSIVQAIGIEHHGKWIAGAGARGEDVELQEAAGGHGRVRVL